MPGCSIKNLTSTWEKPLWVTPTVNLPQEAFWTNPSHIPQQGIFILYCIRSYGIQETTVPTGRGESHVPTTGNYYLQCNPIQKY